MTKLSGQFTGIQYAGYEISGLSRQYDINPQFASLDMAAFLDGSENSQPGIPSAEVKVTSFLDPDTGKSLVALKTPGGTTDKVLTILFGDYAAPTIGDWAFAMYCKEFVFSVPLEIKGPVVADATWKTTGYRPDFGRVLANTTITDTTNFTYVDNGASSANGGAAYLQVLTPASTDSYVVKVQHSTDHISWVDLATFSADGQSRTSEIQEVAAGTTVNRYVRAIATRTGAAGDNFQLSVVFGRR